jgi:hypothetical protein
MRTTIYVASKTVHAPKWRDLRASGLDINSTWIDEVVDKRPHAEGGAVDHADLWRRCVDEASEARWMLLYAEPGEVLKGALVELGAALANPFCRGVLYVGPPDLLTALRHPRVQHMRDLEHAVGVLLTARGGLLPCKAKCGQYEDPRWGGYCDGCAP